MTIVDFSDERHGAFVRSTFRDSLSEQSPWRFAGIEPHVSGVDRLLRGYGQCRVVESSAGDVLGWALWVGPALVYAYTRFVARRRGVLRRLLAEKAEQGRAIQYAYTTRVGRLLEARHVLYWDPEILGDFVEEAKRRAAGSEPVPNRGAKPLAEATT